MNYNRTVNFYINGAYSRNSEMGGWAALCIEDNELINSATGYEPYTTKNRVDLLGLQEILEEIRSIETGHTKVFIYTSSSYIVNALNDWYHKWLQNGWHTSDRLEVKNQDLWKPIVAAFIRLKEKFHIEVIKLPSNVKEGNPNYNKWNSYANLLAIKKRTELEGD